MRWLKHIPLLIWTFIVLIPLFILIFTSLKTGKDFLATSAIMPPAHVTFANYKRVLIEGHILASLKNSAILVLGGSLGSALFGAMTAYILHRFDFFLKNFILSVYIASVIVPAALLQVMLYQLMHWLGVTGTFGAPILIYVATDIITVWMYLQFCENIPEALDESAMMDGASYLRIFFQIILPLLMPATATVLIIKSIFIYNDMFTQYLYMSSTKLQTATMALMTFSGQFATTFNVMAAGCVAVMIPTVILFFILQKYIFAGITSGSVKG
ncbi:sugar ABC transporter permease [Paenibacillus pectinilyticus]|uniref:Sugar ABC transporter permease n=1 Tax=Paenibacillus pectinilyticus TaxID=512399 RepID=A0A1C0ZUP5_9BACL|nr:carbohydrate ABC transporter permease [Paenibacillus pectinilyticus]OCT11826.1 sugar ABC transporter permease [Paenibacillus pectinilyticus]